MKKIHLAALIVCTSIWAGSACATRPSGNNEIIAGDDGQIGRAYNTQTSNVQVEGGGEVTRLLPDDISGSRHQRFIVRLASGQTVLIVHNIDIASRIDGLREGDSVLFSGEYVWNEKGGTVHWTHHDPERRHVAGWLKHNGRTYQ